MVQMQGSWRSVTAAEQSTRDADAALPFGHFAPNLLQRALIALARATILKRGVFRASMTRAILALGRGTLDIRFRGAAYRIRGEQNLIEYGLLLVPTYNGGDIDFLLDGAPPDAGFVDLGCNIGLYSLPLAVARPQGRVVSIDANPKMINRIRWNADATGLGNLTPVHAAVSDSDGRGDLVIRKDDVAIVAVQESDNGEMPIRTLAAILSDAGLTTIHGLKIDIEGHEDRALVPFLDACAPDLRPRRIVIEHPEPQADYPGCTAAFARHGYRLVGRNRNNSLYQLDR
jgi:FkbM family methyltransferase